MTYHALRTLHCLMLGPLLYLDCRVAKLAGRVAETAVEVLVIRFVHCN